MSCKIEKRILNGYISLNTFIYLLTLKYIGDTDFLIYIIFLKKIIFPQVSYNL